MLNTENKYKAFHISFYPHTSLTAGLNILEREIIQGGRGCIYTSTHANEHVYWLRTRSPNYNTIKVHLWGDIRCTYSKLSASLCTVHSLSRQHLKSDIDHSFKNGISKTLHCQTPPFWAQRTAENRFGYRRAAFGVKNEPQNKKSKGQIFFFQLRKQW